MTVQTVDVFQQDVVDVDGERFLTVRGEFLELLERSGSPPDALRFAWGDGPGDSLTVPFPEVQAKGARLAGGAIGWPAPAVP